MAFSSTRTREDYTGNGATTAFPVRFSWQEDADITVLITNKNVRPSVSYDLALNTDFSLEGAGESSGTLTFPTASSSHPVLPTGWTITIRRVPALTQESDLDDGDGMPAEVVESALDRAVMLCGALQEQIDRAVLYPVSTTAEEVLNSADFLDATTANKASAAASQDSAADSATAAAASQVAAALSASAASNSATTATNGANVITSNLTAINNVTANLTAIQNAAGNAAAAAASASAATAKADASAASATAAASSATAAGNSAEAAALSAAEAAQTVSQGAPTGTTTTIGIVRLATVAEAATASEAIAVTPAGLAAVDGLKLTKASNLSDLADKATARTNLGLGTAAVLTAGTSANNLVQLGASGQLPAVSGENLTNLPSSPDLGMMNAFLLWRSMSRASGPIPKGYLHTFQTNELPTQTGAYYETSSKAYKSFWNASGGSGYTTDTSNTGSYTRFDRSYAIPNNAIVDTIGVYQTTASTLVLKIALANAATSYTVVASQSVSHTGSGWEYFSFSYTVPASGTYYMGVYATVALSLKSSSPRAYYSGNASGTVTVTVDTAETPLLGITYHFSINNLTLRPSAITAGSAPSAANVYVIMQPVDTVALSTDLNIRMSRDGGSTWTASSALSQLCAYSGTAVLLSATLNLTTSTTGTSVLWEVSTYNTKQLYVYGVGYVLTM